MGGTGAGEPGGGQKKSNMYYLPLLSNKIYKILCFLPSTTFEAIIILRGSWRTIKNWALNLTTKNTFDPASLVQICQTLCISIGYKLFFFTFKPGVDGSDEDGDADSNWSTHVADLV